MAWFAFERVWVYGTPYPQCFPLVCCLCGICLSTLQSYWPKGAYQFLELLYDIFFSNHSIFAIIYYVYVSFPPHQVPPIICPFLNAQVRHQINGICQFKNIVSWGF